MLKKFYHYKLLLDENMPARLGLPLLNKHFIVRHIRDDLGYTGLLDPEIYDFAVEKGFVVITRNIKHFRPLAGVKDDFGIIGVSENLLPSQLDSKLTALLKRTKPDVLKGKCIVLTV